jgi:hypothetical protein
LIDLSFGHESESDQEITDAKVGAHALHHSRGGPFPQLSPIAGGGRRCSTCSGTVGGSIRSRCGPTVAGTTVTRRFFPTCPLEFHDFLTEVAILETPRYKPKPLDAYRVARSHSWQFRFVAYPGENLVP